jgi:hypothetical protein
MFLLFLEEQRAQARISNSTIRDDLARIEPLLTDTGNVPHNFPTDLQDIQNQCMIFKSKHVCGRNML